jgi:cardiolipin synthase
MPTARCSARRKARKIDGDKVGWRDTHIKIEGPAVARAAVVLREQLGPQQEAATCPRPSTSPAGPAGDKFVRVLATDAGRDSEIYKSLVVAINEAKKSIHITSAYFVPDQQIVDALVAAANAAST